MLVIVGPCSGPCGPQAPPSQPLTERQLETVRQTQQALHEQVVAASSPSGWHLAAFVIGLMLPVALIALLLVLACRSRIECDEVISELVRLRLDERLIRGYLAEITKEQKPCLPRPRDIAARLLGRRSGPQSDEQPSQEQVEDESDDPG